ncbi:MAG: nucleotide exchange factor GrpE [Nitrososphaeria archaeon]
MGEDKDAPQRRISKVEKLTKELEEEKKRSDEYLTRLKYMQADFENYRKRVDKQIEDIKRYSSERLISDLLETVDELEMAIKAAKTSNSTEVLIQGVEMSLKKIQKVLANEGVTSIESLGKTFDPSKHNSVATIEKEDVEEGTIVEEIRKGYIMKDKVIRPSIVKVAVKPCSRPEILQGGSNEQNK